jgi:HlyD family secretion protein
MFYQFRSRALQREREAADENAPASTKKKEDSKPKEIVFVVKDNKAKTVDVQTGISDDNYIEVKSGLKGDEEVVTGSYKAISRDLKDGIAVRVENRGKANITEKK